MAAKTAIIVGSTGLVGHSLLKLLLESEDYQKVISVSRKELDHKHDKLIPLITDFDKLDEIRDKLYGNDVFCCLGSTMKKAGSKANFHKMDCDYPLKLAHITRENNADKFLLISSLGANKDSNIFYSKVKGEVEHKISKIDFDTIHILRPSLILGKRKAQRFGEQLGKILLIILWPFFIGSLKKYKPIKATKIAAAMLQLTKSDEKGIFFHQSDQLQVY